MPQLPGLEESQRISASSPVPLLDTREERMQGAAISDLGEGMSRLAIAMDRVNKEKQRLDVANAVSEWRYSAAQLADQYKQKGPVEGDTTGFLTQEQFRKDLVKSREEITKRLSPEFHNSFMAEINDEYTQKWMPAVTAEASKGLVRSALSSLTQNIERTTDFVRLKPGSIGESIDKVRQVVEGSELLSFEEKQKLLPEAITKMVGAGVQHFIGAGEHEKANEFLTLNKERLTDPKAYEDLKKHISQEQNAFINANLQSIRLSKERYEFEKDRIVEDVHKTAYAMYKSAGADINKIRAADNYIDDAILRYGFSEIREMGTNLKRGSTSFTEDTDNQFKVKVLSHAFTTGDYKKAIKVTKRFTDMPGGITAKSAYGLISQLETFDRGGGNNKRLATLAAEKLLESPITHPDIRMTLDKKFTGPRLVNTVAATKAKLYDWVLANPNASPTETYHEGRKIFNGTYGTAYTDPLAYTEYDKLEDAQKAYEERGRAHIKEKDKSRKEDMFKELQELKKQVIQLRIQKEVPTGEDKPTTVEKDDSNGRY